jgi:predicted alpha/beta superfamily hydrolase
VERNDAGTLETHSIASRILKTKRTLRVWLPPDHSPRRHYPVLYLNDGQNLFESATSFTGVEWEVDETAARLITERRISPLVIVGIDNGGRRRSREYLPYPDPTNPGSGPPDADRYLDFLQREVMPFVARRFRVSHQSRYTGFGGSSYGAAVALHAAITRRRLFGRLLLESPALQVGDGQLVIDATAVCRWPERVYLGVGTRETRSEQHSRQVVDLALALGAVIENAGLSRDRLDVVVNEGAGHHESAWASRFPRALEFLYGSMDAERGTR